MKSLEQEYFLYERDVLRLAEGFCWLADSLAAIAESACWKKKRKEDLKQIILLSERLIEGIEEEGDSKAENCNLKSETCHTKLETRNPQLVTRNLPPKTRNPPLSGTADLLP